MASIGEMTDDQFLSVADPPKGPPDPLLADEIADMDLPDTQWIHGKAIPFPGLIAISGRPGSQKTFFALWVAIRAAAGLPLFKESEDAGALGKPEMGTPVPTLFIEEENTLRLIRERLRGFERPRGIPLYVYVDQGFKMKDKAWLSKVVETVEARGIKLVVMDPFSSVMGLQDENSNAEVSGVMDLIRKELIKRDVSVIFIHHPSKGEGEGGAARGLRGAGDILGKCDVHLALEKDERTREITVSYEKMRVADESQMRDFRMVLAGDPLFGGMRFKYLGEVEAAASAIARQVVAAMAGEAFSQSSAAAKIGMDRNGKGFKAAWEELVRDKKIYPSGRDKWVVKEGVDK